ncbi:MAG TPA: hypothetical protein VLK82_10705 [Candidatus Tectomicrobia bacterium]|nr:hypothetical protein [Candidatus Tectomicrobia bacterium]
MRNRSCCLTLLLSWCVVGFALWLATVSAQQSGAKKVIYYGWGIRDTQYIRDHWQEMEKMPFDGTGIIVAIDRQAWQQGRQGTDNQLGWQIITKRLFQMEDFREAVADLKAAKSRTFTDNFLPVAFSSGYAAQLNWFDDERWRIIVNNIGVTAQIAAASGLKGLILDPEDYTYALFKYPDQRQQVDRAFEEYARVARQRGQQLMAAIAAHTPDAVLLSLYGYTLPLNRLRSGVSLQEETFGLLPSFYDGMLESMPAGVRFVDGYEFAYAFKQRRQFDDGYRRVHDEGIKLSAMPDRYRDKVRVGFGLWLDYSNRPNYFTPEEFRRAVSDALEVSDGYVWIYSHNPRFFPPADIQPAYIEAIAAARRGTKR